MSHEEREIMGRHAACWQPLIEAGQMVVLTSAKIVGLAGSVAVICWLAGV